MACPRCGREILDPDPRFCPRCGYEFAGPAVTAPKSPAGTASVASPVDDKAESPKRVETTRRDYLLSLFTVVGGVVGYRSAKKYNPRVASTILTVSLLLTLVYLGAGYEIYLQGTKPSGTPGLAITAVSFPNSSAVVVTVANHGTAEDGLESVAINNGSIWLVYGLLSPDSPQASSELRSGSLSFSLYGYILANGTTLPAGGELSATVGTEGFPPGHVDTIAVPFSWTPLSNYTVFISTSSGHPYQTPVVSPA